MLKLLECNCCRAKATTLQWGPPPFPGEIALGMATLTAMAMVMTNRYGDGISNGNGNGDGNGNGNGWRQRRSQWQTARATAMTDCDGNGDGDGGSNCIGNGHGNNVDAVIVTMADTREGCLFIHRQFAELWQGQRHCKDRLPPLTQSSVHCPELRHGGATTKSVCSISGGGILTAHHGLVFLFFTTTVQFIKQPFVPPYHPGIQEPCQPMDALPSRILLHHFPR